MAKVLVVDDALFMRKVLIKMLTECGLEIAGEAQNGTEAVEKYKELKPDLVTLDIIMPGENGIEVVKKLININPEAKIIVVSAIGQISIAQDAVTAGAKDVVLKPINKDKLLEAVNKLK